jgi:hypothetical protein
MLDANKVWSLIKLLLILVKLGIFVGFWLSSSGLHICSSIFHFFKALGISRANEVCLHVINPALWIHQVLLVFTFDLNHPHHDTINHVH